MPPLGTVRGRQRGHSCRVPLWHHCVDPVGHVAVLAGGTGAASGLGAVLAICTLTGYRPWSHQINGVVDSDSHSWLHVMEVVLVWIYAAEVMMKLFAFHKEFFHSWWNIFDFVIVGVTVVLLVLGTSMEGVLVGRSLKLFSVANRSLRVLRIVIKVYSQVRSARQYPSLWAVPHAGGANVRPCEPLQGSSMSRKQQVMSHAYPIEQVVAILHKVRFSSDLSRQERQQISFLINSLMANTLYAPRKPH